MTSKWPLEKGYGTRRQKENKQLMNEFIVKEYEKDKKISNYPRKLGS